MIAAFVQEPLHCRTTTSWAPGSTVNSKQGAAWKDSSLTFNNYTHQIQPGMANLCEYI